MSEFTDYLKEVLAPFGTTSVRRMFGGYGVYHDGLMFALVADDVLYFKTDSQSASWFEAEGMDAFIYIKKGKAMKMSYFQAPEAIYDDPDEARLWAGRGYDAALRARAAKK